MTHFNNWSIIYLTHIKDFRSKNYMSEEPKKKIKLPPWANYVLIGLEVAFMIGLVIVAFLAMAAANKGGGTGMIKWLITHQVWFFVLIVFPLIALFLFNVYLLIKTMNDSSQKEYQALTKEEMIEEARRQAREELEKELAKLNEAKSAPESPKSEDKAE